MIPWLSLIIMSAVALTLVAIIIGLKGQFAASVEETMERTTRLRHELGAARQQLPIDPTTGLGNSVQLEDDWTRLSALHQRRGDRFSFVALRVTDAAHGEPLEPPIMKRIAQKLFELVRTEDYAYRLDVDTFAFLLTGCGQAGATVFAERAADVLGHTAFGGGGSAVFVDTLAGAAEWEKSMGTLQSLIQAAIDNAAQEKKKTERKREEFQTADFVP